MLFPVTSITASILAIWFIILSARVIRYRGTAKVTLGDGGNEPLTRRIRAQANFSEYVPVALILLFIAEAQGYQTWALSVIAGLLVFGRLIHGYAFSFMEKWVFGRVGGMLATFGAIVLLVVVNVWSVINTL